MADVIMYCKKCGEKTDHTHLAGRTCSCSKCGEYNKAKNVKQILANIKQRKKESRLTAYRQLRIIRKTEVVIPPAQSVHPAGAVCPPVAPVQVAKPKTINKQLYTVTTAGDLKARRLVRCLNIVRRLLEGPVSVSDFAMKNLVEERSIQRDIRALKTAGFKICFVSKGVYKLDMRSAIVHQIVKEAA